MSQMRVCEKCGRIADQVRPRLLCRQCWLREEQQDRLIAAKFDAAATPELPFGASKETRRHAKR